MNMTTFNWALKASDALFGESDSSKKEKEKKDREAEKKEEREYQENKEKERNTYRESLIKQADRDKLKQTALDSEWLAQNGSNPDLSNPSTWELMPDVAKAQVQRDIVYREALAKIEPLYRKFGAQLGAQSVQEFAQLVNNNPELSNIVQNVTAKEGLEAGLPKSSVRAALSANDTAALKNEREAVALNATRPRWGEEAVTGQTADIFRNRFGSADPNAVAGRPAIAVLNDRGGMDVRTNPAFSLYSEDNSLAEMTDPDAAIAKQLGFTKGAITINPDGTQATHARPAMADPTKSAGNQPTAFGTQPNALGARTSWDTFQEAVKNNRTVEQQAQVDQARKTQLEQMIQGYKEREEAKEVERLAFPDTQSKKQQRKATSSSRPMTFGF